MPNRRPTTFASRLALAGLPVLALAVACAPPPQPPGDALTPGTPLPTLPPASPTPTSTATSAGTSTPTPSHTPSQTPATPLTPTAPALPEVEQAVADLAQRLNVTPAEIVVVDVQAVEWTDTSMGCPQPGQDYLQVITAGLFIQLAHADQLYNYHSGGGQPPFLCQAAFPA
jgi:cytoskeletal protein RodZ